MGNLANIYLAGGESAERAKLAETIIGAETNWGI
jgi:hypothetical protein